MRSAEVRGRKENAGRRIRACQPGPRSATIAQAPASPRPSGRHPIHKYSLALQENSAPLQNSWVYLPGHQTSSTTWGRLLEVHHRFPTPRGAVPEGDPC